MTPSKNRAIEQTPSETAKGKAAGATDTSKTEEDKEREEDAKMSDEEEEDDSASEEDDEVGVNLSMHELLTILEHETVKNTRQHPPQQHQVNKLSI